VVDDGLATGATAKARYGPAPQGAGLGAGRAGGPPSTLEEMRRERRDRLPGTPRRFYGVGAFFDDFHQLTDDEMLSALRSVWNPPGSAGGR